MDEPHAFFFVQHSDLRTLARAVLQINITRRQRFFYRSVVLSAPRDGWVALLLGEGGGLVDHLLARNLSGRLQTTAFELQVSRHNFSYRLYADGQTIDAFESNLTYYVNLRVSMLEGSGDPAILDLSEPVERFVLARYHDLMFPDAAITLSLKIPDVLQAHYRGNASRLKDLLPLKTDASEIARLLAPGFHPVTAFNSLLAVLDLPYLPGTALSVPGAGSSPITDLRITQPATWLEQLPSGWQRIPALPEYAD